MIIDSFQIGIWIGLGIVGFGLIWLSINLGSMQKKFTELGRLKGKKYKKIVEAVGKEASHVQYLQDGSIRVWSSFGYQITLLFDDKDVCQGVSNETTM